MLPRPARLLVVLVITLAIAGVAGCSKSGDSTSSAPPVTGPTFSVSFPASGASQQITFTDIGSWTYHCIPHQSSGMTGTVVVDAGAADDSASVKVGADSLTANVLRFSPPTVRIRPGGHVRWYNVSSMMIHTVSRP